jgi:hypothetical protein
MNSDSPTPIFCNNLSSVKLVRNPVMHSQTKYFAIHHHYVREKYKDGTVQVVHVPSDNQ